MFGRGPGFSEIPAFRVSRVERVERVERGLVQICGARKIWNLSVGRFLRAIVSAILA
jgi:hypothetical protein